MRKIMLALILAVVAIAACTEEQEGQVNLDNLEQYKDAVIEAETFGGFTPPDNARQVLVLEYGKMTYTIYAFNGSVTSKVVRQVDPEVYYDALRVLLRAGFLEMDGNYTISPENQVADASDGRLTLSLNGRQKTVDFSPFVPDLLPDETKDVTDLMLSLFNKANELTEAEAKALAEEFVRTSPTFKFDGSGLELVNYTASGEPKEHVITYRFTSSQGGYGDRTGKMSTDAITDHVIVVTIIHDFVANAYIDGVWDEVLGTMIGEDIPDGGEMPQLPIQDLARDWIMDWPTYRYDGQDLEFVDYIVRESYPEQHVITYRFTSTHGGYGDREGQMVTQALTPHTIVVTAVEGKAVSAIIDGTWDELNQEMLEVKGSDDPDEPVSSGVAMTYSPMQCQKTPWEEWYEEGNINFIKAPTDEELIIAYYGTEKSIDLKQVEKIMRDEMVCQACDICPATYYYRALVDGSDVDAMVGLGWKAE